jgi:hypothetical protein
LKHFVAKLLLRDLLFRKINSVIDYSAAVGAHPYPELLPCRVGHESETVHGEEKTSFPGRDLVPSASDVAQHWQTGEFAGEARVVCAQEIGTVNQIDPPPPQIAGQPDRIL